MREMRSSIVFLGAILSRCGEARLSFPGGCELGPRPIDLHLEALRKLGAEIRRKHGCCCARRVARQGSSCLRSQASAQRKTCCSTPPAPRAQRCSQTPRVSRRLRISLGTFLNRCGAHIHGAGESCIVIEGVPHLYGSTYTVMPDRIAAATIHGRGRRHGRYGASA